MIRPATLADLPVIENIYAIARRFMRDNGNPTQWWGGYPKRELLESDIEKGELFVYEEDGVLHGVFAFILGEDPTYAYIEDGKWPNSKPYGTIHRLASDGSVKGIFEKCLAFCREKTDNVRVDTHHDNHTMQHLAEKHGFQKCGVIYLKNGDPRLAYHWKKRETPGS